MNIYLKIASKHIKIDNTFHRSCKTDNICNVDLGNEHHYN